MPLISILMPYRKSDDSREKAFEWSVRKWQHELPEAEIIVASDDGKDPFSKTIAVNKAYRQSSGDVLAIVDADIYVPRHIITNCAKKISQGQALFVQPCNKVARISKQKTEDIYNIDPKDPFPKIVETDLDRTTNVVGLICMFSRDLFEAAGGMDPRFRGWGWEDSAWIWVMRHLYGKPWVGNHTVYHLWHDRVRNDDGKPIWAGQTNRNNVLGTRYKKGVRNPEEMKKLIEEVQELTNIRSKK